MFNFSPIPSFIEDALGSSPRLNKFVQNFDPSNARLAAANLVKGGASTALNGIAAKASNSIGSAIGGGVGRDFGSEVNRSLSGSISNIVGSENLTRPIVPGSTPTIEFRSTTEEQAGKQTVAEEDWRIKIDCPALGNSAVFPVLPLVTFNYTASYSSLSVTHSNYKPHFYDSSEVQQINITGAFPVHHDADGQMLLDTINFFKATTKMYFGTGTNAGNPPPIVFLDGYGKPFMSRIPCVVVQFNHNMPTDVDYVKCGSVRLPSLSELSVTLQPVISRAKAGTFNLNDYAMGNLPGFM